MSDPARTATELRRAAATRRDDEEGAAATTRDWRSDADDADDVVAALQVVVLFPETAIEPAAWTGARSAIIVFFCLKGEEEKDDEKR